MTTYGSLHKMNQIKEVVLLKLEEELLIQALYTNENDLASLLRFEELLYLFFPC
jgi:hypothetical protein